MPTPPPPPPPPQVSVPVASVTVGSGVGVGVRGPSTPLLGHVSDFRQEFDKSRVRDAPGSHFVYNVSAPFSSLVHPSSLLFPLSDSGFASHPPPVPFSSSAFSLPLLSSSTPSFSSIAPSAPLPLFLLPSVVPSVLSLTSASSSFAPPTFSLPPVPAPHFPSAPPPPPPSVSHPSFPTPPLSSTPVPPPPGFSALPTVSQPSLSAPSSSFSSSSSSAPVGGFAEFHARVLGLSAEYQALGRWFVALGGSDFRAYLASYCPHLYADFRADFASGSSCFLSALASSSSLPLPSSTVSPPVSSTPFSSLPPVAPVPVPSSASLFPSAPPVRFPAPSLTSLPSSAPSSLPPALARSSLSAAPGFSLLVGAALGWSAAPVSLSDPPPPPSVPSFFRPFATDPAPSAQAPSAPFSSTLPSAPSALDSVPGPSFSSSVPLSYAAASSSFVAPDELPEGAAPDSLPQDEDSAVPVAVPEFTRSEFRRMLAFLVDLFPQAAGSHSAPPPPRALFEEFFGSSAPRPLPIFLSWFERVRMALADADACLASFLSSGSSDFSFLPPRNTSYAVQGDFALGHTVPVNPFLSSLFERQLKPSYHVGLTLPESAALESSLRCHPEALSQSMWVLSGLLGFVKLQNFAPADVCLFNTLVTSLSKNLAHQAFLCASHTAFLVLKHR